jgi:acyl-CoA synthetase (AMP-forming)/AMP-acid ligase II
VPPGEVGELAVRGPTVMNGYHGREWPTRQPHGWRRTNDLGRREADGSITFVGTAQRMLKSGVENVYPADVEAVIGQHPAVEACALIGLPDPTWAQTVCAIVVVRDGHQVSEQEIMDFCKERMAGYKKPRTVMFTESIPTKDGFTDYEALDDRYGGGGYPGY